MVLPFVVSLCFMVLVFRLLTRVFSFLKLIFTVKTVLSLWDAFHEKGRNLLFQRQVGIGRTYFKWGTWSLPYLFAHHFSAQGSQIFS